MLPSKLKPIPKVLFKTPCYISINETINEDSEPVYEALYVGKCIVIDKAKQVLNAEKHIIRIEGTLILDGDIAPGVIIASGEVIVNNVTKKIYRCYRPHNPDGSVHHTEIEVM